MEASDGMIYGTARGAYGGGYHGHSSIFQLNPSNRASKDGLQFSEHGEWGMRMRADPGQRREIVWDGVWWGDVPSWHDFLLRPGPASA